MPLISVITAVHGDRAALLRAAGESVAAQQLPSGWSVEWLIQEDGVPAGAAAVAAAFPFARHSAHGDVLGPGGTRNLALARAGGDLVHVLDSDDLLLPNALASAIETLAIDSEIHWAAGQADDLMPDGTRLSFPPEIPTGPVAPGVFGDFLIAHDRLPVHPAGVTARTATVRALGGWGAYPRGEDTVLLAALSELTAGQLSPEVTWLYRRHDAQITHARDWSVLAGPTRLAARQRLAALRELRISLG
ncbi:glycosyltransferase family 2 protein [Rhodococcus sp. D2-41]|uniref:Glycosyltransferase family 2 protein n=1 Tax=Speluncibacter jeojiensis TaxID=2710754 RepID=A0A9X4M713_9ACTN|nr:glycosyltransferase family A protein [Rhodococcus sp. D2-41]MDG3012903.1 glycosyltransferase family 2 protein [Rhodococcus sp. D2-41]MDG3017157.1 glycosyltransferase family 2 protein [Corynebacteriales bacterium D3-21]